MSARRAKKLRHEVRVRRFAEANRNRPPRSNFEDLERQRRAELAQRPVVTYFGEDAADAYVLKMQALLGPDGSTLTVPAFCKSFGCEENQIPSVLAQHFDGRHIQRVERGEDPLPPFPLMLIYERDPYFTFELFEPHPDIYPDVTSAPTASRVV